MEEILGDFNLTIYVIYLNDVISYADTLEEHLTR